MALVQHPVVHAIHESNTGTWQYIVADAESKHAAIIDPVLDFDPSKNEISTTAADLLLATVESEGYLVERLLETHLHADHLSGAAYLGDQLKQRQSVVPKTSIGSGIAKMQQLFGDRYGIPEHEWSHAFDCTYADGEKFSIGSLEVEVLHLPGHTPDHIGYLVGRNVFTGDSIFNPELGSARCDFPQGSASALWTSMQRLLSLPEGYKLYTGHDYPPAGGDARPFATVQEHKASNKHVKDGTLEWTFIDMRTRRDAGLNEPKFINQALQFNIRAGRMPKCSAAGDRLIHVPLKFPKKLAVA